MIYAITRWWKEQRNIRRMMSDHRTGTLRAALIMIACILVIAALLFTIATATAEEFPRTMYACTESTPLNVRERPNLHSEIVGYIDRGDTATVIQIKDGWALVTGIGEAGSGWASLRFLTDKPPIRELTFTVEED